MSSGDTVLKYSSLGSGDSLLGFVDNRKIISNYCVPAELRGSIENFDLGGWWVIATRGGWSFGLALVGVGSRSASFGD